MSTAAPASPSIVRASSSSRRGQTLASQPDWPHRTLSAAARPTASPASPQRAHSHSQPQSHSRSASSSQQANLVNVARKDFEQTNLARPSTSRRSSSRDRSHPALTPARDGSTRSAQRTASRHGYSQYAPEASSPGAPSTNGVSEDNTRPAANSKPKNQKIIETETGRWSLGKTIGAGSMGKVKLARNLETGEQVCIHMLLGSYPFSDVNFCIITGGC